jgi:chromosome segregation ATPase
LQAIKESQDQTISQLQQEISAQQSDYLNLKHELQGYRATTIPHIAKLEDSLNSMQDEVNRLREQLHQATIQNQNLQLEEQTHRQNLTLLHGQIQKLRETELDLRARLGSAEREVERLQSALDHLNRHITAHQALVEIGNATVNRWRPRTIG